jgi:hypothetical protein
VCFQKCRADTAGAASADRDALGRIERVAGVVARIVWQIGEQQRAQLGNDRDVAQ